VFVTRAAGSYTAALPAAAFAALPERARRGELHVDKVRARAPTPPDATAVAGSRGSRLRARQRSGSDAPPRRGVAQSLHMYFDDELPLRQVTQLCSLACAVCAAAPPGTSPPPPPPFHALSSLAHHLKAAHKQHMCDICLQARKVFVSQQHLYTKARAVVIGHASRRCRCCSSTHARGCSACFPRSPHAHLPYPPSALTDACAAWRAEHACYAHVQWRG
jgi:hypothetical protein